MKKIKTKKLLLTIFILFVFIFGGIASNFASSTAYAKSTSSGGSFKSGSFSSPKSSSGSYKSGSFSNTKKSTVDSNTNTSSNTSTKNSNTYSSTKRSFLPIPFFIPWGHSGYGYGSPIAGIIELIILIIFIIFIVRLFKKYKRRR